MLGLIGKKIGMSQVFTDDAKVVPVTVIKAGPCKVIQKKTKEKEGYRSVQLAFEAKKDKNVTKPLRGHFKDECYAYLREFTLEPSDKLEDLDNLSVDIFSENEVVDVIGKSKGRGFAGVMKRHNFHGMKASHGVHENYRGPGSIGQCATPSRVFKGKKLPGHYGNSRVTVKNLEIVKIDKQRNIIMVKGAIPGHRNSLVLIRKTVCGDLS